MTPQIGTGPGTKSFHKKLHMTPHICTTALKPHDSKQEVRP